MSTDGIFMCIVAALGSESKSFEEVRIEDYVHFYQTTGRAPPHVPQEPSDEFQRKTLGLPPLFKPQTNITLPSGEPLGAASSSSLASMTSSSSAPLGSASTSNSLLTSLLRNTTPLKPRIMNPADIPIAQEFRVPVIATEKFQSIVCMPEYEGFSPEEVRCYAYLRGNITSPFPIAMDPFVVKESINPATTLGAVDETLQSQCALAEYSRHSPEELRVAFMLFGREMTSDDLSGPQVAPTSTALALSPLGPQTAAVVTPPVIAASTSTASKFNFVFK